MTSGEHHPQPYSDEQTYFIRRLTEGFRATAESTAAGAHPGPDIPVQPIADLDQGAVFSHAPAQTTEEGPDAGTTETGQTYIDPGLKSRLSRSMTMLPNPRGANPESRKFLMGSVVALAEHGIYRPKTILLAGSNSIHEIPGMRNPDRITALTQAIDQFIPEIAMPSECDPQLAAQICDSLDDVPLVSLWPGCGAWEALRKEYHLTELDQLSVKAALEGHLEIMTAGLPAEYSDDLRILRQKAEIYAERFLQFQNAS